MWENASTCVAAGSGRAAASNVSTDTPVNVMSNFDHVVTQWMSPVIGGLRERVDLVPRPRGLLLHEPLDAERPRVGGELRRGLGGEHRPALAGVVLAGWQALGTLGVPRVP